MMLRICSIFGLVSVFVIPGSLGGFWSSDPTVPSNILDDAECDWSIDGLMAQDDGSSGSQVKFPSNTDYSGTGTGNGYNQNGGYTGNTGTNGYNPTGTGYSQNNGYDNGATGSGYTQNGGYTGSTGTTRYNPSGTATGTGYTQNTGYDNNGATGTGYNQNGGYTGNTGTTGYNPSGTGTGTGYDQNTGYDNNGATGTGYNTRYTGSDGSIGFYPTGTSTGSTGTGYNPQTGTGTGTYTSGGTSLSGNNGGYDSNANPAHAAQRFFKRQIMYLNPNSYGALHKTLPIGSYITVTNPDTNKSVTVQIVGRPTDMPVGRCLTLTRLAFSQIAELSDGVAHCTLAAT